MSPHARFPWEGEPENQRSGCRRLNPSLAVASGTGVRSESVGSECDLVSAILDTAATIVVVLDSAGRVMRFNRVCEQVTGYTCDEVLGQSFCELIIPADEQYEVCRNLLHPPGLKFTNPWEVHWRTKSGEQRLIAWSTMTLLNEQGLVDYVIATGSDISVRRHAEDMLKAEEARLNSLLEISQRASELSERDLIQHTLNETVRLTQSDIGYLHFVNSDQETLQLYAWSSATMPQCSAVYQSHYPISQAGVWADSVRTQQPVVHNDYPGLTDKRGLPAGHAHLLRHTSVPILDGNLVVLVLGVGNKVSEYTETDVRQIRLIGDHLWRIVRRKRAEDLMRESESRYRTLVEMSPDAIFLTNLEGRFLAANRQFLTLYGYRTVEEIQRIGLKVVDLVAEHDRQRALADALRTRRAGMVRNAQYDTFRQDGSVFPAEVSLSIILDADGRPCGFMGVSRDITDRKSLEAELRQHVRALQEEDCRRNDFLAMLAHELRNPLAPISSAVEVLRRHGSAPELTEKARDVIGRQVQHMIRLVDDLLDVSRITRGKIEIQRKRMTLQDAVHHGIEISRTLIDSCGHELTVSLPEKPLYVYGDSIRLAQVVANLLNNAAKYTPDGGQILVAVQRRNQDGVIEVRDNGVGIPADLLPRVFDLFVQADRSLDRSRGGLGLGLTLVRQLVELHGGTVQACSAGPGCGSEFVVQLPLAARAPKPRSSAAHLEKAPGVTAGCRVLVVDDHADSAAMLAELLNMHGQEVRTADSGPAALEVVPTFRPDLVLLDIGLPDMDGYEVARRLRRDTANRGMRLVALSGFGHKEALDRSREAGFQHHLVKPVNLGELLDLLQAPPTRKPAARRRSRAVIDS
jgi:PAS domain S-box-containing protein